MNEPIDVAKQSEQATRRHIAGEYLEAEKLYRRALAAIENESTPAYQDLLVLNVRLLFNMGELANAQKLGHQLLKLREKHFGFHHTHAASALRLLAEIRAAMSNIQQATLDVRRALDIWMDTLGWQAQEPDPTDFELHQMGGPRVLLPEFDWISSEIDRSADVARLTPQQKVTRRFTMLLEIASAFSWLGFHKTANRLSKAALSIVDEVPPLLVWQYYSAATQAAQSYLATKEIDQAEEILNAFLRVLNAEFDNGSDVAPPLLVTLATVEIAAGKDEAARRNLKQALELMHQIHGESHLQIADIHIRLGDLLARQKDAMNSEMHFDKSIAILESWHGTSDMSLVKPFYKKGLMHNANGQYPQAEKAFARALEVLLPKDQADVDLGAHIFEQLSTVYMRQCAFQQAQMAQMRGLDLLREFGRPTDLHLAHCEVNMARIYFAIAKYVDAEKNALGSLNVFEKHPDKAKHLSEIATLYLVLGQVDNELGKFQSASQFLRQSEGALEGLTTPRPLLTEELNLEYAKLYVNQGMPAKAISRIRDILDPESESGPTSFSQNTIDALILFANTELATGKTARVEKLLIKTVNLAETRLGKTSPPLLKALSALGTFYINQKNLSAAEAVVERGVNILDNSIHLKKEPAYGNFLITYASLLFAKGAYDVATEKLKRALSVYEGCFSRQHPKCAEIWMFISQCLLARGIDDQADEAAHKAVTICSNAFEWNHYAPMRAVAWEAYIAIKRERFDVGLTLSDRLFPAIQTVRVAPDIVLARSLCEILKNELVNERARTIAAIQEYVEKHSPALLYSHNEDAVDTLLDLMTFIYKRNNRELAVTIGNTVVDYLGRPDCLIEKRKSILNNILLRCRDYAWLGECKELMDKISKYLAE